MLHTQTSKQALKKLEIEFMGVKVVAHFYFGAGDQTHGSMNTRQALHHLEMWATSLEWCLI